jgi:citrate lyase subunit beta/citryl-CoA lyase
MAFDIATMAFPLFVPANRLDRLAKAIAARPDAIIIDLEDAVPPSEKAAARDAVTAALPIDADVPLLVRINAAGTPWAEADLLACRELPLAAIMVPKAEDPDLLADAARATNLAIVALIESARGVANIDRIAPAASRLAFGSVDYAADLGLRHSRQALLQARSRIVLASRCANLPAPLDGVTTATRDEALLRDDCDHAIELGFGGKLLIHPAQLDPARRAFAPTASEVDWASKILDHAQTERGAFQLDGEMIDAPVIARARQIAARSAADPAA